MDRNPLRRDFTLAKAALLVALLGLAGWMGDVPVGQATAHEAADPHHILPAAASARDGDCVKGLQGTWRGAAL